MRKIILLVLLGIPTLGYSQFNSIRSEDIKMEERYDSTYNIGGEALSDYNYKKYIGQKVIITDTPGGTGMQGFSKKPKKTKKWVKFKERKRLEGRSFTIVDVIEDKAERLPEHLLKLIDNENGDILYYNTYTIYSNNPFLIEAYYERLQRKFNGKCFYYVSSQGHTFGIMKDMTTGKKFYPTGMDTEWLFEEMIIDQTPEYLDCFCVVFAGENGRKAMVPLRYANSTNFFIDVDLHKKLYGTGQNAQDILEGRVRVGWTKNQCIRSWGMPKSTNTTMVNGVKHEQLVYDNGYLYFEDGILTAIQQ